MDFTSAYRHASSSSSSFSPGSTFVASLSGKPARSVLVRQSVSLAVIRSWDLPLDVSSVAWSPDGAYLLATSLSDATCFVLSLDPAKEAKGDDMADAGEKWVARITAGAEGLVAAQWGPNTGPLTVFCFGEDQLRVSVYELATEHMTLIEDPKRSQVYISPKQDQFALLQRSSQRDGVSIFARGRATTQQSLTEAGPSERWRIVESFPVATNDATELSWSPSGSVLAVWESNLEYKLHIYTPTGWLRGTFWINPNDNEPSTTYPAPPSSPGKAGSSLSSSSRTAARKAKAQPQEQINEVAGGGLGIRTVEWRPNGDLLSIGGYDEKLRLLEQDEWQEAAMLDHSIKTIMPFTPRAGVQGLGELIAWREPQRWMQETGGRGIVSYERSTLPLAPAFARVDADSAAPKVGIVWQAWSPDGRLLASRNENVPGALFIWAFPPATSAGRGTEAQPYLLAFLQHGAPIEAAVWKPGSTSGAGAKLAIVCGTAAVYLWEVRPEHEEVRQRAEAVPIPIDGFAARSLQWSPDGYKLLLADSTTFCCALEAPDDESRSRLTEDNSF